MSAILMRALPQPDRLLKLPEHVAVWKGVVYCERNVDDLNRESRLRLWGGRCLCAGPFLFFGDPELLEEIRSAIQVPCPP
jgi:hypothetical protein